MWGGSRCTFSLSLLSPWTTYSRSSREMPACYRRDQTRFGEGSKRSLPPFLGERLPASKPLREGLAAYANGAGIELGYSYFAPRIPGNAKLVFELHYPDGRVEYDLPHVAGAAAGYRVATLLDNLLEIHYARLREAIV